MTEDRAPESSRATRRMTEDTLHVTAISKAMTILKNEAKALAKGTFWVTLIVDPKDARETCSFIRDVRNRLNMDSSIQIFEDGGGKPVWDFGGVAHRVSQAIKEPYCTLVLNAQTVEKDVWRQLEMIPHTERKAMFIIVPNENQYEVMRGKMPEACRPHLGPTLTWPTLVERKADYEKIIDAIWDSIQPTKGHCPNLSVDARRWLMERMERFKHVDVAYGKMRSAQKFAIELRADNIHPEHFQDNVQAATRKNARQEVRIAKKRSSTPTSTPTPTPPPV